MMTMTAIEKKAESFCSALHRTGMPRYGIWGDDGQKVAANAVAAAAEAWNIDALGRLAGVMKAGWHLDECEPSPNTHEVCPGYLVTAYSLTHRDGTVGRYIRVAVNEPFWDVVKALGEMFAAWTEGDQEFTWLPVPDPHTPWCRRSGNHHLHGLFSCCTVSLGKVGRLDRKTPARLGMYQFRDHGLLEADGPTIHIDGKLDRLTITQAAELADLLNRAVDAVCERPTAAEPTEAVVQL